MFKTTLIFALSLFIIGEMAWAIDPLKDDDILFVGYPNKAYRTKKNCNKFNLTTDKNAEYVCMDEVVHIEYEITDLLRGKVENGKVSFFDTIHGFEFPEYLSNSSSYIHLRKLEGGYAVLDSAEVIDDGEGEAYICAKKIVAITNQKNIKRKKIAGICSTAIPLKAVSKSLVK